MSERVSGKFTSGAIAPSVPLPALVLGAFGAVPEGWRSLKENEKAFRKVKSEAKRLVEQEQELARKVGPIRQRKMAALHHEFNVVPTATGAFLQSFP